MDAWMHGWGFKVTTSKIAMVQDEWMDGWVREFNVTFT